MKIIIFIPKEKKCLDKSWDDSIFIKLNWIKQQMLNITWIIKTLRNIIFKMTEFRAMFRELSSWYKWLLVKGFCGQRTFSRVAESQCFWSEYVWTSLFFLCVTFLLALAITWKALRLSVRLWTSWMRLILMPAKTRHTFADIY